MTAKPPASPDAASLGEHLRNLPQYLLPQGAVTAWVHRLTRIRAPWFKDRLIRWFIGRYGVDMSEAANADPGSYADFNAFFTRALRDGVRPLAAEPATLVCPVDGAVSQAGAIAGDTVFQAKGHGYSLTALLGGAAVDAAPWQDGAYATLYLSPRDYHRIHMPVDGTLRAMLHVPGRLFSVSRLTTRCVPGLFARNERVVTLWDTAVGPMALVLVGAINVASMQTVWAGTITPPRGGRVRRWDYPASGEARVHLARGEELGRFNMGSTVILAFGPGAIAWDAGIHADAPVRMGQPLARPPG
ncbi:phosphatidylserine decarboxylase [Plasticicumulans lactativorans]|uniref:Phosphatidylserine decarboxylase proenzyme n=1 Tax=Plasticicumulans lactativorans TaxID=1133106 RepID=A0A4R2L5D6_9GAMM|nr:archaetidylserine decarboxylase [Plasticicumulans lactativorans]TCO81012.1 phosphatidylserine decarboxylase [Plasticicumulans lactativorans]